MFFSLNSTRVRIVILIIFLIIIWLTTQHFKNNNQVFIQKKKNNNPCHIDKFDINGINCILAYFKKGTNDYG